MLRTRVITAIVGFIVAAMTITIGGHLFNALIVLLALLAWREFGRMVANVDIRVASGWGYIFVFLLLVTIAIRYYSFTMMAAIASILVLGLLYIFSHRHFNLSTVAYSYFGLFYITGGFAALMLLRDDSFYTHLHLPAVAAEMGPLIIWLLLFCTWASDTFAYFAGSIWGKRRIVPTISPNKTLEGFIGGFIGCMVTGLIYAYVVGLNLSAGLTVGLLTGIFAPFGDLFESKIKRTCGIKDSGVFLPGHGGVLDRFDSLLFSAPVLFVYLIQL